MEFNEDSFLQLSGIQHFAFCRRQWALIHIDHVWAENARTTEGHLFHEHAHDAYHSESRGEVILSRAMPVFSRTMGISGECDVVEFRRTREAGISLQGREGRYCVYPVEYKRGVPKDADCDRLQLTAQAMCLEEMLCCTVTEGALYYFETRRRVKVEFTDEMRQKVSGFAEEMHRYFDRQYLPRPRRMRACNACSLQEICMPELEKIRPAKEYNEEFLGGKGP